MFKTCTWQDDVRTIMQRLFSGHHTRLLSVVKLLQVVTKQIKGMF